MTDFGKDLIQAMTEAVDHAEGRLKDDIRTTNIDPVDVRAIRDKLGVTQTTMSAWLGVSVSGYRKWEQGQARPRGAARTLLMLMERDPKALLRSLGNLAG